MPRIRLEFTHLKKLMLSDGVHSPLTLEQTRLEMQILLPNSVIRKAIIDTGAPYTLISKSIWSLPSVQAHIDWLLFRPEVVTPISLPDLRVAGKQYYYRIGNISLQPIDEDGTSLPAITTTCKLLEDDSPSLFNPQFIIGLTRSLLNDSYLVIKPSAVEGHDEAWLTSDTPSS